MLTDVHASTRVCGIITGEHWTKAGSPYLVTCDVVVTTTLTIDPGVSIVCQSNSVFEVNGVLTAIGTIAEPITFTQAIGFGPWKGILFNYSGAGSKLIYCVISGSVNGGIRIIQSAPDLQHCTITNNSPVYNGNGGGIWAEVTGADLVIQSCTVAGNSCSHGGGGAGIWAKLSGGDLVLRNCTVTNNSAYPFNGGGIYASVDPPNHLELERCVVAGNTVWPATFVQTTYGGGVYVSGNVVLRNCALSNNVSTAAGSGLYTQSGSLTAANSVFSANKGSSAIFLGSSASVGEVLNCTIAFNERLGLSTDGNSLSIQNSILYYNNSGGAQVSGSLSINYSGVQNGYSGTGNLDSIPYFLSETDLRIAQGSPYVDAGNPGGAYNDSCFPPSQGGARNDLGAYGGPGACGWFPKTDLTISLTAPTNGTVYTAPARVTITVSASDTAGSVTSVDFYHESMLIGSTTSKPFTLTWTNVPAGSYTLTAKATDDLGAVVTSAPIFVTVNEFFKGLVAYYPFNGDAIDETGYGNNGAIVGNDFAYDLDRFGGINSLRLNRTSTPAVGLDAAYVLAPRSPLLDFNKDFTLSAWINLKSGSPSTFPQNFIGNGSQATTVNLRVVSSHADFGAQDLLDFVWSTSPQVEQIGVFLEPLRETWWQSIVVRSGTKVSLFRNGTLLVSGEMTTPVLNSPSMWFGTHYGAEYPLIGGIDDVRMFNRGLSADEVMLLFEYERAALPNLTIAQDPPRLACFVAQGTTSQVESSTDLKAWSSYGPPLPATNWIIWQDLDISRTQQFFRVKGIR